MGHRRFVLLGLAVAVLFSIDNSVAASKSTSRSGGPRRSSKAASRSRSDDRESQGWNGEARKGTRRSPVKKSSRGARDGGVMSSRAGPSRTSSRGARRGQGMEMVPSRRGQPKSSMLAGLAATVKGKAASMQEDAKGKVTEWRNIAKTTVWFSSKMEKFMIHMTWPDDTLLDEAWVKATMKYLEDSWNKDPRASDNPNKRLLRKLWLRMKEEDYRTKLKALQILHYTTMDLSAEATVRLRNQFMRMRDQTSHKNRNEVYFEPGRIMSVTSSGTPFLPLLRSYSAFTFRKMTEVPGGPKQIASMLRSKKTSQSDAVAMLRRLDKLICAGIGCKVDRETMNTLTGQVIQLTARDLMSLWRLYVKGLTRLIKGGYKESKTPAPEEVARLLTQYGKTQESLERYLVNFKKIVRDRSVFENNQVDPAALEVCLASVAPDDQGDSEQDDEGEEEDEEDEDEEETDEEEDEEEY